MVNDDKDIIGRAFPDNGDNSEYIEKISYLINDFLIPEKRDKIKSKEFKSLIKRKDVLSAIELYQISNAIQTFINENEEWFKDYRKTLQTGTTDAIRSKTFELISAYSFKNENQKVKLSEIAQPGYDFTVNINNYELLVSCKKLQRSDEHIRFLSQSDFLFNQIYQMLHKYDNINNLDILCQSDAEGADINNLYSGICNQLKDLSLNHTLRSNPFILNGNFVCGIKQLNPFNESYQLSQMDKSLRMFVASKYPTSEQKRFINLFKNAAKNLKKHTINIGNKFINMIMIGLPDYISLEQAGLWMMKEFENNYSSIAVTVLFRQIPAYDVCTGKNVISNEIKYIPNLQYKNDVISNVVHMFSEFAPMINFDFGSLGTTDSKQKLVINKTIISDFSEYYIFQKGKEVYQIDFTDKNYIDLNLKFLSGTQYKMRIKNGEDITLQEVPFQLINSYYVL